MASLADAPAIAPEAQAINVLRKLNPTVCFWIAGLIAYGGAALNFATGHFLDQIPRDLWQHLATLRALIENPVHPANPFIPTDDFSRHYHPYWVGVAWIARLFGWNEWQAIAFAGFVGAGTLLAGIYAFGRTFFRDSWGPVALLAAMVLGWLWPVSNTGYHSMGTLIEGVAYPAVLLIGLSFLLWAAAIRALQRPQWSVTVGALSALMFAIHPLGAGIGFLVLASLTALWPDSTLTNRAFVAAAVCAGLLLSTAWPYFNPLDTVRDTGNATWAGGVNFYAPLQILAAFVPQALGLIGLVHAHFRRRALPILVAFGLFAVAFLAGLIGVKMAIRFLMPAVLMLQIGLAAMFIVVGRRWASIPDWARLGLFGGALLNVVFYLTLSYFYLSFEATESRKTGNVYEAAKSLTADIPDMEPVGAFDVGVWPVVATGQRAASVPWPEPGISDLAERQRLNDRLFDPALTKPERVKLAKKMGVRTLIIARDTKITGPMPQGLTKKLQADAIRVETAGPFLRFDLY